MTRGNGLWVAALAATFLSSGNGALAPEYIVSLRAEPPRQPAAARCALRASGLFVGAEAPTHKASADDEIAAAAGILEEVEEAK
jgi:hypothetical protein